jgi:hypothetical protein
MSAPEAERWFFSLGVDGQEILLRARCTGALGAETIIGDAINTLKPGAQWFGLTYEELAAAGAGVVIIENDIARIVDA